LDDAALWQVARSGKRCCYCLTQSAIAPLPREPSQQFCPRALQNQAGVFFGGEGKNLRHDRGKGFIECTKLALEQSFHNFLFTASLTAFFTTSLTALLGGFQSK
jgi:hypothetical protein